MKPIITLIVLLLSASSVFAAMPDEQLEDPALEARARSLSQELRCVVCQNQSIDDSAAPLARDLRIIVREQLSAGKSDEGVKDYLVKRYGTYVLLRPPLNTATLFLWFGPALLALLAGWAVVRFIRSLQTVSRAALPDEMEDRSGRFIDEI
jgi:cytochrome c-type biogenesis protein CcmH